METTVEQIFANLPGYFNKGVLDKDMTIYFSIGDDPTGKCTAFLTPDTCEIKPGKAVDRADLVLKTSPKLFIKMVMKGYTPGASDFMMGRVKSNNPMELLTLKKVFRFPGG